MLDWLIRGGLWFTLPLTLLAVSILVVTAWDGLALLLRRGSSPRRRRLLHHLGLFSFVFGLLGHASSFYEMMQAIEHIDGVTPALVASGLRVSMIVPLYGLAIFASATMLRLLLKAVARWRSSASAPASEELL